MKPLHAVLLVWALLVATSAACWGADAGSSRPGKIRILLVHGGHDFETNQFLRVFRDNPEVSLRVVQEPAAQAWFKPDRARQYDVLVFYNFHLETPDPSRGEAERQTFEALTQLGETQQGILVLHHALVAYDHWPFWDSLIGTLKRNHGYAHDQHLHVRVARPDHPITHGLADFDLVDETYPLDDAKPEDGNTILLTVDHPNSMHTLAWTRQHRNARVLCWQSGHDNAAWSNPTFATIMARGIQWLAGRLH